MGALLPPSLITRDRDRPGGMMAFSLDVSFGSLSHALGIVWPELRRQTEKGGQNLGLPGIFLLEEVRETALPFRVLRVWKITRSHLKTPHPEFLLLCTGCLVWHQEPLNQEPQLLSYDPWWRLAPEPPFIVFPLFLVSLPHLPVGFPGFLPT